MLGADDFARQAEVLVGGEEGDALETGEDDLDDVTVVERDESAYQFNLDFQRERLARRNPQSLPATKAELTQPHSGTSSSAS